MCDFSKPNACLRAWAVAVICVDCICFFLLIWPMIFAGAGGFTGVAICAALLFIACIISITAASFVVCGCCGFDGPSSRPMGFVVGGSLLLAVLALCFLAVSSTPCQEVKAYCAYGCKPCGVSGSLHCDEGVSIGSAAKCKNGHQYKSKTGKACGQLWCWKLDQECSKAKERDKDDTFWGFMSEESCESSYGDLKDSKANMTATCVVVFLSNLITRLGVAICAFCWWQDPLQHEVPEPVLVHTISPNELHSFSTMGMVQPQGHMGMVQPQGHCAVQGTPLPYGTVGALPPYQPDLPPGWQVATDPHSGKAYYYNLTTNETSWDLPCSSPAPPIQPPPPAPPPAPRQSPMPPNDPHLHSHGISPPPPSAVSPPPNSTPVTAPVPLAPPPPLVTTAQEAAPVDPRQGGDAEADIDSEPEIEPELQEIELELHLDSSASEGPTGGPDTPESGGPDSPELPETTLHPATQPVAIEQAAEEADTVYPQK